MTKQDRIKNTRKDLGLTQSEASKLTGIKQSNLSELETGYRRLTNDTFFKIMKAYGKDIKITFE